MPLAMITGGVFYKVFGSLSWMTPYLIFLMLLFTFSKLSPKSIKISKLHFLLLFLQIGLSLAVYISLYNYNIILAQGAMICFLAPTATSAAVITGMLKGDVGFITTFTLISNFAVALIAPILFSMTGLNNAITFVDSATNIFVKVFPLLILPLLFAWLIRFTFPKGQEILLKYSKSPFYFWSFALMVVTGKTVKELIELDEHNIQMEISLALISLLICILQFVVGKFLGSRFNNRIASGQSLGQKNTILAIWMSQVFLNPISALAPSTYILWQNTINSWQLWKARRNI